MLRRGESARKSTTTRRMVQNVREAGFMEKKDLRENLINQAPNLRVSGVPPTLCRATAWQAGFRCQEVSIAWSKKSEVRSQRSETQLNLNTGYSPKDNF
jgi:hypothetical protein